MIATLVIILIALAAAALLLTASACLAWLPGQTDSHSGKDLTQPFPL